MEERQRFELQQREPKQGKRRYMQRQQNRGGFLDMLEQRYRHQQFQEMVQKVQKETNDGKSKEAPKNGAAKPKGETLLAKAAREQMMHLEALQNSLNNNGLADGAEDDQGQNSGRSDEGPKNANKKRRRRTGKR